MRAVGIFLCGGILDHGPMGHHSHMSTILSFQFSGIGGNATRNKWAMVLAFGLLLAGRGVATAGPPPADPSTHIPELERRLEEQQQALERQQQEVEELKRQIKDAQRLVEQVREESREKVTGAEGAVKEKVLEPVRAGFGKITRPSLAAPPFSLSGSRRLPAPSLVSSAWNRSVYRCCINYVATVQEALPLW